MAINQQQQQYTRTRNFIPLDQLPQQGAGESGRFVNEVTGVLLGIEARPGFFEFTDRRTGEKRQKPNSALAVWSDGSMTNWPWMDDGNGGWKLWDAYDQSINLAACIQGQVILHFERDDNGFCHLELVAQQQVPVAAPGTYSASWQQ